MKQENNQRRSVGRCCLDSLLGFLGGGAIGATGISFFVCLAELASGGAFLDSPEAVDMFYKYLVTPSALGTGLLVGAYGLLSGFRYNSN